MKAKFLLSSRAPLSFLVLLAAGLLFGLSLLAQVGDVVPPLGIEPQSDIRELPEPPIPQLSDVPVPPPSVLAEAVVGLVVLFVLAYVSGSSRIRGLLEKLPGSPLVSTGLVFVLLGTAAASPPIGILSDYVLGSISPIVPMGLGWIGFRTAFRFRQHSNEQSSDSTEVAFAVLFPMLLTVAGVWLVVQSLFPGYPFERAIFRDSLLLGLAAAMSSPVSIQELARKFVGAEAQSQISWIARVEHAAGVFGLLVLSLAFRPETSLVKWNLPPTGWLFIAAGVGSSMGIIAYLLFRSSPSGPALVVALLGIISMTAGLASYLRLSAVGVCFLAGLAAASFEGPWKSQVAAILDRMEYPVYGILLVLAGAAWVPTNFLVWPVAGVFVISRLIGKQLAFRIRWGKRHSGLPTTARTLLAFEPVGVFAIAIIITGHDLYPSATVPGLLTAVILGAIATEIVVWMRFRLSHPLELPVAENGKV